MKLLASGVSGTGLKAQMPRMWLVTAASNSIVHVLQIISMGILARILQPESFGLIAMVMSILGVAAIFQDLGLSAATVRATNLTDSQSSTILITNIVLGLCVSLIAFLLAPLVGAIYDNPVITALAGVLAWNFLLSAMGAQHLALMRRHLKFTTLAKINLAAVVVGQVTAITLALNNAGHWSLVYGLLVTTLVKSLLGWLIGGFPISKPKFDVQVRALLSFGGWLTIFSIMGFIAMHIHSVFLGVKYGAEAAGLYGRAFTLYTLATGLIAGPLASVAPAVLSKIKADLARYRQTYLDTIEMQLLLTAPLGMLCYQCAPEIIMIILGPAWLDTIPVFRIIALAAIPQAICASSGWLYMSNGDSKNMMIWGLGGWSSLIVMLAIGAEKGVLGVAVAYTLGMCILTYPCMMLAFRWSKMRFSELFLRVYPVIISAIIASITSITLVSYINPIGAYLSLISSLLIFSCIYAFVLVAVFGKYQMMTQLMNQLLKKAANGS